MWNDINIRKGDRIRGYVFENTGKPITIDMTVVETFADQVKALDLHNETHFVLYSNITEKIRRAGLVDAPLYIHGLTVESTDSIISPGFRIVGKKENKKSVELFPRRVEAKATLTAILEGSKSVYDMEWEALKFVKT